MSTALQQHGRSIAGGFSAVNHRVGAACGELVSTIPEDEPEHEPEPTEGLSRREQIGIVLAVFVLLVGGGIAVRGP